jgi:gas vesicle protein GvpL/GvpF
VPEEQLLWAYGIVPASQGAPAAALGIDGTPVAALPQAGIAALVSRVPAAGFARGELERRLEDLDTLEALARAHDGVLEAALDEGDVVPFAMCTLFKTPDGVRELLAADAERLTRSLELVRGMAEWGVKAFAVAPQIPVPSAGARSGTEYLLRRRAEAELKAAADSTLESSVAGVHAELAAAAAAAVLQRPQDRRLSGRDDEMLLNASYLIPRDRAAGFAALVREISDREASLELELTGPWPPYHFVGKSQAWR